MKGVIERSYDQCRPKRLWALVETRVYSRNALAPAARLGKFSQVRNEIARFVVNSAQLERNRLFPRLMEVCPECMQDDVLVRPYRLKQLFDKRDSTLDVEEVVRLVGFVQLELLRKHNMEWKKDPSFYWTDGSG